MKRSHNLMIVWSLDRTRVDENNRRKFVNFPSRVQGKRRRVVAIAHQITARDVADPMQIFTKRPGRFLFRGIWPEGHRVARDFVEPFRGRERRAMAKRHDPRNHKNFMKVEGPAVGIPIGKVVGNRLSPFLLRRMGN